MASIAVCGFKTVYKGDKEQDWVLVAPVGEAFERTKTWHRVDKIRPPEDWDENRKSSLTYIDMAEKWKVIGPAYDAWKQGQAIPVDGTPLAAWSGVTAEKAEVLKQMGIYTVEQERDMSETAYAKLPFPNARDLPKLAGEFLSGKDKASLAEENARMKERMEAMETMLEEMSKGTPKRGPGRPKKADSEAAA